MARLALADSSRVDAISRESHALWGGGLTLRDYRGLWDEIARTAWARKHVRYKVWLGDDGELLSSAKVYRPLLRLHGRESRCTILGAIFTPRERRRRGHARALLEALLGEAVERGDAAMLFSDIGTEYYERLGFRPLPAQEQWGRIPPVGPPPPPLTLRPATPPDWPRMLDAHADSSRDRPIALVRDLEHWEFLWIRSAGFFGRLRTSQVRQRWEVATREGEFAGYVLGVEGHGEWNLREVGAVGGDPQTTAEIVEVAAAAARAAGLRRVYGWLPQEVLERLAGWALRGRARRTAIPMLHAGVDRTVVDRLLRLDAVHIPFQDQF